MNVAARSERQRQKDILNNLWDIHVQLEADVWEIETRGDFTALVARRSSGQEVEICRFSRRALPDEIRLIAGGVRNLCVSLDLIQRAAARVRQLESEVQQLQKQLADKPKDYAANAAILCQGELFHRFLEVKSDGEVIADKQAADARMKELLTIKSKKEINNDERAREAFLSLRAEFELWKRGAE
ncbi:hypothetical protein [Rhizobium sp. WW_1]|jgi:hypothetical protein|uniref:hypothetical protein n=1 Tax=Rhizobium sp. WW_1 TaxID=1907375 RepID=UPI000645A285|nr:hypothetical protein [Rhizobium sp. WW_1]RKD61537.1 hypothetical protein BJ928_107138 [Rhizobium sp. WW_1]